VCPIAAETSATAPFISEALMDFPPGRALPDRNAVPGVYRPRV
jgi:hypothetical protein